MSVLAAARPKPSVLPVMKMPATDCHDRKRLAHSQRLRGSSTTVRHKGLAVQPQLLCHLDLDGRSRCLACGETAKGIEDDAHSTRVRSTGRSDGHLAGVGRLGASLN